MRGDTVTVKNISFQETIAEEVVAPNMFVRYAPHIEEGARIVALLVVVALTFIFVVRPLVRRLSMPQMAQVTMTPAVAMAGGQRARTVAELENEIGAQLDAAQHLTPDLLRLPVLTKRVTESSQKEPEHVARVLRSWMNEQGR
jgi:flagellar biosynthesis/type III secretory pathway M-ring protein FliF/YscJ